MFNRIFVGKTFGTGQLVHTAVRARIHYIVLYVDGLAVFSTDKGHGVVTVLKVGSLFILVLFYQFGTGYCFGIHRYQCLHTVTTVNVQQLASRAQTVSGINIATELAVVIQTPVVPVIRPELFQIMYVRTFYVKHFTEKTFLNHIQSGQFEEIVNTIFKLHAVLAGLFGSID